jgi:hypothetical protein
VRDVTVVLGMPVPDEEDAEDASERRDHDRGRTDVALPVPLVRRLMALHAKVQGAQRDALRYAKQAGGGGPVGLL